MAKPIALAADHGGFELKEAVKAHLKELGLEYIDFWHPQHRQRGLPRHGSACLRRRGERPV